jgi:hypothetical protein
MKIFKKWLKNYKKLKNIELKNYPWINFNIYPKLKKFITKFKLQKYKPFFNIINSSNGKYHTLQYLKFNNNFDFWSYRIHLINILKQKIIFKNNKPTKIFFILLILGFNFKNLAEKFL